MDKYKEDLDKWSDEVAHTAAAPFLRDMLTMSRGQFKKEMKAALCWGADWGYGKGFEDLKKEAFSAIGECHCDDRLRKIFNHAVGCPMDFLEKLELLNV